MSKKRPGPDDPDHVVVPPRRNGGKLDYTYIIGGILLWGLIGWGLDFLLQTAWIVFAALPVDIIWPGIIKAWPLRMMAKHNESHHQTFSRC